MAQIVKNLPATTEDPGSVPGLERSPGGGRGYFSSILAWRTPWTEEPGRIQSMGQQRSDTTERLTLILTN